MAHGRGVAQQYHRLLFGESQRGLAVFEIVWDPDGQPVDYVIVGLNDKFAEMFGCDAHAVVRTRVSQSLPEIMEMWQDALAVTAQSGVDQEIELFHLPTEAWLKVSLYSPAPNLVGLVVADMTAWVETAQALEESQTQLKESERFLQSILDNAPVAIWLTDPNGNRLLVNKRYEEDTGIGTPHCSLTEEEQAVCRHTDMKTLMSGGPQEFEEEITFQDGEKHTLRTIKTILRKDNGEIVGILGIGVDITALKRVEAELWRHTYYDSLTGLYNRRFVEEEMIRLEQGSHLPISVIMADVDGLKLINDALGHQEGDLLLQTVADVLLQAARPGDIVGRWAGDEFVVLMPRTDREEANHIANRIRLLCKGQTGKLIPISAAVGVATKVDRGQTMAETLNEAETLMYKRKTLNARETRRSFTDSLKRILLERTGETEAHMQNLQVLGLALGQAIGLDEWYLHQIRLLAVFHDIGKVRIPVEILRKRGPLTPEERDIIQMHPETGYRIASIAPDFQHAAEAILAHHEHWDGSGYPEGLQGEAIPLAARIHAVTNWFDVLYFGRPHRPAASITRALRELKVGAGTLFEPRLVDAFVELVRTTSILEQLRNSNPAALAASTAP
jgi:diguanylate cyclase (GGDEF)-like protein/PAS domain S-box-containing protein